FRRKGFKIVRFYHHNKRDLNMKFFNNVTDEITSLYESYDAIDILSTQYKSPISNFALHEQLLPIKKNDKKKEEESEEESEEKFINDYFYELTEEEVLRNLALEFIETKIANVLLESEVSETSARMTAMDSATKNADDLLNKLILYYNRARQAGITREIIEISSGAEALA
ncbi:F0F1 ATP synthase subunit gamma, partial [bacterium]|nr:F0F1 ATP synthase subunit gamma [bacterium]